MPQSAETLSTFAYMVESIRHVLIGLAGRRGLNRFGRLSQLTETTLVETKYVLSINVSFTTVLVEIYVTDEPPPL